MNINNERLTLVEIMLEKEGRVVKSFHAYSVPAIGEDINWGNQYRVEVLDREWVIDTDINPSGNLRCVLICKKIVWPRKG